MYTAFLQWMFEGKGVKRLTTVRMLTALHVCCVLKLDLLQANGAGHVIWAIAAFACELGLCILSSTDWHSVYS